MALEELTDRVKNDTNPISSHVRVLRVAFEELDEALWDGEGIFDAANTLRSRGLSFGRGDLMFNRTLDAFYLAQLAAGIYRFSDQLEGDFPTLDDFDAFYQQHCSLLDENAWKEYYTEDFLRQPSTARYWRLPNRRDLPDGSDPIGQPRAARGIGHFTKLPRWARTVVRVARSTQSVQRATIAELAMSTLKASISNLREHDPKAAIYSETQARFWLERMGIESPPSTRTPHPRESFAVSIAQGAVDVHAWEAHYSPERWSSAEARETYLEPDLDGTKQSEVMWCGMPDGGIGVYAWWRGWEPELGSEEEIAFLTSVAIEEVRNVDTNGLNLKVQSHALFAILETVLDTEGGKSKRDLRRRLLDVGALDESRVDTWMGEVGKISDLHLPASGELYKTDESRLELFRTILLENGQLFANWRWPSTSGNFNFALNAQT